MSGSERSYKVAFVVGEDSGDLLGSRLMESLSQALPGRVTYCGLGGERMEEQVTLVGREGGGRRFRF